MIVSVIGSGSECIGYGEEIDSSDYVVRIWDCFWHNEKDHGTKYDIGIIRDVKGRHKNVNYAIKKGIFKLPKKEWWLYGGIRKNIIGVKIFDEKYFFHGLPVTQINLEGLEIKSKLTTGTAAIVGAINLKPSRLMLYGFDSLTSGKPTKYHKRFQKTTKTKMFKVNNHNCSNDWSLIKELGKNIEIYHYGKRIN